MLCPAKSPSVGVDPYIWEVLKAYESSPRQFLIGFKLRLAVFLFKIAGAET